ncbi:hypothetical protein [Nocardia sp. NPDC005745]|uniref:hypothetical protein n=1 Tax=Nocardia sp. NPDC005745 TaxID=3157061 RepID=UPI0033F04C51
MNSVTASVSADRPRPAVRSRRTAVTFDSAGGLRLGGIAQFSMAVTDFADLARDPEAVIVGGRIWSPANLVAAVVGELRAVEPGASEAGVVTTYPAVYSYKQVALLRQALDLSGAGDVLLVPEPVAAAEWLEHEYGPLETGFVLIYDLGGTSLDVSIVRVGRDWDNHPMIGKPLRSYDFGGRPLGSMIARYAPDVKPGSARSAMTSIVDIDGLRTAHVQDSLQLVRECVRESGVTLSDIGCILLVGGASRPAEVARTLAELGPPVLISADPGQATAAGAALMAARTMALGASDGRSTAPRVAVFSSAAVVSAVAMSAVTVFGGPTVPELSPLLERLPELGVPTDSLLVDVGNEQLADAWSVMSAPTWNSGRALLAQRTSAYTRFITPAARDAGYGPSVAESRLGSHRDPRNCCAPGGLRYRGYGDPAYFVNPLPFAPVVRPAPGDIGQPPVPGQPAPPGQPGQPGQVPGQPPASGTGTPPGSGVPAPQNGSTPAEPAPASGGSTPGNPSTGTSDAPGTGTGSDEHGGSGSNSSSSAGTSTGGSSSGDSGGTSSGGTPSSSGSTSDSSANGSSGDSPGGSSSAGSAGNSSTHGSSSAGDSSSDGSSSAGSAGNSSSVGSSSGGSAGNSSTHGSSSGGSAGNSSSDGSSSAGSAGNSSTHGSSSGGSAGNSSAGGSSSGGSAGNSSAGGSPSTGGSSSGRPGGASSAGGHSTGNSSGASSSGGSRGRSGSVGGSSGGSSAGGAGGAGGGGARGR